MNIVGLAIIGGLVIWFIRRSSRDNSRKQRLKHQPDDFASNNMAETSNHSGFGGSSSSPFQQHQQRPFVPPTSPTTGYGNMAPPTSVDYNNNSQYYHHPEHDMGADYYNPQGYYYATPSPAMAMGTQRELQESMKPDEPTIEHKPNLA